VSILALFASHCPLEWEWLLVPWFAYQIGVSFVFTQPVQVHSLLILFNSMLKYVSWYELPAKTTLHTHTPFRCITPPLIWLCKITLYIILGSMLWCLPFAILVHVPKIVPCIACLLTAGLILYTLPFESHGAASYSPRRHNCHWGCRCRYLLHRRQCADDKSRYQARKPRPHGLCKKDWPVRKIRRRHHGKTIPLQVIQAIHCILHCITIPICHGVEVCI